MRTLFSLRRRSAWAVALYASNELTLRPATEPIALLPSRKLFRGPRHIHTKADPFLFQHGEELYLFYEEQALDEPGSIAVCRLADDGLERLGTVLSEEFHLSYPQVFAFEGQIYMMPESQAADALLLYRFDEFPHRASLVRRVMEGQFADPTLLAVDGIWYLFATTHRGLELFMADNPVTGEFRRHPLSPITSDLRHRRSGGGIFEYQGVTVRPAQDETARYGGNLNLMAIDRISPSDYAERLLVADMFACDRWWNAAGGHHISIVHHRDRVYVAVDGQSHDYFIHKVIGRAWMILTGYRPGALKKYP